ncbi:MAG: dTDP-4-amino-4,6-dideoxygalactose transaminase [Thermodesulfobacteriota bacterium]
MMIPFNKPFIAGKELFYISRAVLEGNLAGNGRFTKSCQKWMEDNFGSKKVLLTNSCTAALEMSALLCNVGPEDEVIMPSFTFVSTANAFALRGAKIRFVDIRPDTLNIDENHIEAAITKKTKVIVPVHYAGVGCEMDRIMEIARHYHLTVIEDAAQGVQSTYKNRFLGTIGNLGAYSFHETKNIISGEGGALLINDDCFIERAEIIRDKGTNRRNFLRGEVDKYSWVDLGSSFLPSELVAAFLYAQLEQIEAITRKRLQIVDYYHQHLSLLQEKGLIRLPVCPSHCRHNSHMFYILVSGNQEIRDKLLAHLQLKGVWAVFHYIPLHTSPMGKKTGRTIPDLPVTDDLSARLLRLPCYFEITREEQDKTIAEIYKFFRNMK